jgi:hypothetical protein
MNKVTCLLCVLVVIALVLPYCGMSSLSFLCPASPHNVYLYTIIRLHYSFYALDGKKKRDDIKGIEGAIKPIEVDDSPSKSSSWHKDGQHRGKGGHRWKGHHRGGHKEGHQGGDEHRKEGHHWDGHEKEGHHWGHMKGTRSLRRLIDIHNVVEYFREKYGNLTVHFVEDSLPPSVYVVLADKGIEVLSHYCKYT